MALKFTSRPALDVLTRPLRLPLWPGWRHLPREARDTLFLLGVIAWTMLPHLTHQPDWCLALSAVVLLWRARLAINNAALPGRWWLVAVLLLAAALTYASYGTLIGKESGVTMAVVLVALKTMELRARRDAFVVFFLGFFLVLTHFLYSQSLLVAAAMLISVWGLLTALVLAHMPVGQPSLRQASTLAARTALLGLPIMVLLFVLFPRIGPLWGVQQDDISRTGLSNSMRMGSVAQVAQDDSVALRLKFSGRVPPPPAMYFRGPVLTQFDGREWRPAPLSPTVQSSRQTSSSADGDGLRTRSMPIPYEMTLEPNQLAVLPLLEATSSAPLIEGYAVNGPVDLQWIASKPVAQRLRFEAVAYASFQYGPLVRVPSLATSLELPNTFNPRTLAWAAAMRADPAFAGANAATLAQSLLQHIRTGGYSYTLAPGTYGRDAIDEFWLDRRDGFCEHFAASFVVIMRALGVPARVVTGYQGADPQPVDGYYVVRQSSAHAWAEYWQAGVGWVRADPTAAVAPERIDRSRRLITAPGLMASAIGTMSPALLAQIRGLWEGTNNRWNQWVLNYSSSQQLDVLKHFGFESPSREDLATLLIGTLSTLALLGAAWAWWDQRRVDPWTRQMQHLRDALQSLGLESAVHDTPRALAGRVRDRFGELGDPLMALLVSLERQRYSAEAATRPDAALTRHFVEQARRLRNATR